MTDKNKSSREVEDVQEILEAIQETVPQLIRRLVQSIYSPEVAESIAESVGTLYQSLKKKGLPDDLVLEMTRTYMNTMDIKKLISESMSKGSASEKLMRAEKLDVEID